MSDDRNDTDDLVARLKSFESDGSLDGDAAARLIDEAADALLASEARIGLLEARCTGWAMERDELKDELLASEAQVRAMRGALETVKVHPKTNFETVEFINKALPTLDGKETS